jgi:hypothetical protein
MNVIFGYVALYDFDIHAIANFPDQIPNPNFHVSKQYRLAIFFPNIESLLKSSPKGEGFSRICRWGH